MAPAFTSFHKGSRMNRKLIIAVFILCPAFVGDSVVSAAVNTIEGFTQSGNFFWQPMNTAASVGDVVEWKIGAGDHGVRITNWAAVKGHVDVVMVPGQQPFNATTGRNNSSTTTAGKVLLRLKIKSVSPEIKFNCIVHGGPMSGTVSVASALPSLDALMSRVDMTQAMMVPTCSGGFFLVAPSLTDGGRLVGVPVEVFDNLELLETGEATATAITTVRSLTSPLRWENNTEQIEVGKEIQWVNGRGPHGLRITNWDDIRDSVDVIEAHGSPESFAQTGATPNSSQLDKVYARLRINSIPSTTDTIEYNCVVHGNVMTGTVRILPAAEPPVDVPPADKSHSDER
jgi:hypothetical protein